MASIEAQFPGMSATDLQILEARVELLRDQQEIMKSLAALNKGLKEVERKVRMNSSIIILFLHAQPQLFRST